MRRLTLTVSFVIGLATSTFAAPFQEPATWPVSFWLNLTYFTVDVPNEVGQPAEIAGQFDHETLLSTPTGDYDGRNGLEGTASLDLGTVQSIYYGANARREYRFSGGPVSLVFWLPQPDGSTHRGTFTSTLRPFVMDTDPEVGSGHLYMTDGRFDHATAKLFGMPANDLIARYEMFMDFNLDDYNDATRFGKTFGSLDIAVPEPAMVALLGVGFVGFARRRMRRRSSESNTSRPAA